MLRNQTLTKFFTPLTVSHILQFLGLCSYMQMFIKRFAEVVSLTWWLTRKGAEWLWTEECEAVFTQLKEIVGWDITLKDLDYSQGGIRLAVDSSELGVVPGKMGRIGQCSTS